MVDQGLDLRAVELDALYLRRQLLAASPPSLPPSSVAAICSAVGPLDSIASKSRISRSCMRPSLRAFDQPMMALNVIGLSHRPQIMMSRPASMRLAIAISPSRES